MLNDCIYAPTSFIGYTASVAYLECVKGGGPGGLEDGSPQWGPGAKPR